MPENAGVVDAGVVLTRLDRRRRSHHEVLTLFHRSARDRIGLHISVVNLAEVLQHSQRYTAVTGVDPIHVLHASGIAIHRPDVDVAKSAALLGSLGDVSLADRFALATASVLGARLHTTDRVLADWARRRRILVTVY